MGGHLLLLAHIRGTRDLSRMPGLLEKLSRMLGDSHPDLVALRVAAGGLGSPAASPVSAPPMFALSWTPLVRAGLVPVEIWRRVQAGSALAPYLVWATDDAVQAGIRQDLGGALLRTAEALGLDRDALWSALPSMAVIARNAADFVTSPVATAALSGMVGRFSPVLLGSLFQNRIAPALPDVGGEPIEPVAPAAGGPLGGVFQGFDAVAPPTTEGAHKEAEASGLSSVGGLLGGLLQGYVLPAAVSAPDFGPLWDALVERAKELGIPSSAIRDVLATFLKSTGR